MCGRGAHPESLHITHGPLTRVLIANVTARYLQDALLSTRFAVTQYYADVLDFYHS